MRFYKYGELIKITEDFQADYQEIKKSGGNPYYIPSPGLGWTIAPLATLSVFPTHRMLQAADFLLHLA